MNTIILSGSFSYGREDRLEMIKRQRRDALMIRLQYAKEAAYNWPSGRRANDVAKVEREITKLSCAS
mgnify:FL=1